MECNKEGAIRALEIAEKRLLNRDYAGAKEMALKAEKLFPQLDNISQLLTVSEVHCSAQLMANGLYDWYKIIQVEPKSDEILIRKQYRKLALLLHPDKNKFPGAEAAFKLVGEANNTLSDRAKRIMYDLKREHLACLAGPQQSTQTNAAHNSYSNINRANQNKPQQQPPPQSNVGFTFWTACPGCRTHYQYYCSILSKKVYCINCPKSFVANALPHLNPGHTSGTRNQPQQFPSQQQQQMSGSCRTTCIRGDGGASKDSTGGDSNPNSKPITSNLVQRRGKRFSAATSKPTADPCPNQNPNPSSQPKFSSDVNPSKGDENQTNGGAHGAGSSTPIRRSLLNKPDVKNNGTEADVSNPAKKARVEVKGEQDGNGGANAINTDTNASTCVEREVSEQDRDKGKEQVEPSGSAGDKDVASTAANVGTYPDSFPKTSTGAASLLEDSEARFVYPDPFCNFDKLKDVSKFAANQIWALYDDLDGMPRFYARICNVYNESSFKVKYTWLAHDPVNKAKAVRSGAELTVGCGNYTLGKTEMTDDRFMFSHMVLSDKGKKQGEPFVILPRKGEVWALFKDWNFKWGQKLEKNRKLEYEVVEVLSDFSPANGVAIVPLVKVQGFVSVFVRVQDRAPIHVPHGEIHRFSHSIPAYRLNSSERNNLPEGSLELDAVALPTNLEIAFPSVPIESIKPQTQSFSSKERNDREGSTNCGGSNPSNEDTSRENNSNGHIFTQICESPQPNADVQNFYEYPDSKFYNFDMCRTCDHFQWGQIWALYSDLDTYPKYYGWIQKVEPEPFKVYISWLEACPKSEVERVWLGANQPISCGKFKVTTENTIYDKPDYFSHMISVSYHKRGNCYKIFPEVGEIWAVYKNWSAGWTLHDLNTCEFDIVQIREQREESTVVLPMKQVPKYRSVFMLEQIGGRCSNTWEIPANKYIMFSHRIPAFRLTKERGGKLRGFWELDPASVPYSFFNRDK